MRSRLLATCVAASALGLGAVLAPATSAAASPSSASAPDSAALALPSQAIGLTTDGRLVGFSVNNPSAVRAFGPITGLTAGTRLIGIDYRVQDRILYGVGSDGGVWQLFPAPGATTALGLSPLTVPLSGQNFDIDFNPAADRLRIVSDTGQNLRHDLNPGGVTTQDSSLTYAPPTVATGVTAAAYTNNDLDATSATTLFDLDTTLDQVAIQAPPNAGTLNPTGGIGVDARGDAGLDIQTDVVAGRADSNRAFATLRVSDNRSALYRISVLTGKAQLVGSFPRSAVVVDLALTLDRP